MIYVISTTGVSKGLFYMYIEDNVERSIWLSSIDRCINIRGKLILEYTKEEWVRQRTNPSDVNVIMQAKSKEEFIQKYPQYFL